MNTGDAFPCCASCRYWEVDFKLFEHYEYNFCGLCRRMTRGGHVCPDWEGVTYGETRELPRA